MHFVFLFSSHLLCQLFLKSTMKRTALFVNNGHFLDPYTKLLLVFYTMLILKGVRRERSLLEHFLNHKHVIRCVLAMGHRQSFTKNHIPCLYMQGHLEANRYQLGVPPNSFWTVLVHQVCKVLHQCHAHQYQSINEQNVKA